MGLEELLFGIDQDELLRQARAETPAGQVPDKAMHRLGSRAAASRIGAGPAFLAGLGRETVSGIKEKLGGAPFFSERGFDPADMQANLSGLTEAASQDPVGSVGGMPLRYLKGLFGGK